MRSCHTGASSPVSCDPDFPSDVGIVGGGRWALQHAYALLDVLPMSARLHVLSEANPDGWIQFQVGLPPDLQSRLTHARSLGEICAGPAGLVVVARMARDHAEATIQLLKSGKRVLVEKPFALNAFEAERVINAAGRDQCAVSLPFLYASYLDRFVEQAAPMGAVRSVKIAWHDGGAEIRHGSAKRFDPSVNVVLDAFAHVWCLLVRVGVHAGLELTSVDIAAGGSVVMMALRSGNIAIEVSLKRNSEARKRLLVIEGDSGNAELDFSSEPGIAHVRGGTVDVGSGFASPLRRMLGATHLAFAEGRPLGHQAVAAMLAPTHIALSAAEKVRKLQFEVLQVAADAPEGAYATRELILDLTLNSADIRRRLSMAGLSKPDEVLDSAKAWLEGKSVGAEVDGVFADVESMSAVRKARHDLL